ncbi:hypothetical protein K6959_10940 [Bacillus aquiflavi]|uniref:YqgU-like beta propeller domain-containing protein n=1 Tax=Bacillus aquiflavi TaxID=2672567 RepID=UPI001CA7DFCC|nr:hypothetical protein [Bacillus aquiflavi]UAC47241.1 hypothetical protein K6959_10940 [Bacillus aquiflavi]
MVYSRKTGDCNRQFKTFIFILTFSVLVLAGCKQDKQILLQSPSNNKDENIEQETRNNRVFDEALYNSLKIQEGQFYKIVGWLNDDTILYLTNLSNGTNVYTYNIFLGKSELLYNSKAPIAYTEISPWKNNILIHSAPSEYLAIVTVIDQTGKLLASEQLESAELSFAWSSFNENKILISTFNEDWSFKMSLWEINKQKLSAVSLTEPFVQWITDKEVGYLKWDHETPALTAPFVRKNIKTDEEKLVPSEAIHFHSFGDYLLAISVNHSETDKAEYIIFDKKLKKLLSFKIPHLSRYSDWLIPYYDIDEKEQKFYTFRPKYSKEEENYRDDFLLVAYDLITGKEETVIEGLNNEPISVSPDGEYILYGYQFEKLINLKTQEVITIIEK